jgi:hypothetical protein
MNKNILIFIKKDEYVYLKSHIFSYRWLCIQFYLNFLLVMNKQLLNAKKSWICIEDMHCQFVVFHSKGILGFKVLNLNAYPPKF